MKVDAAPLLEPDSSLAESTGAAASAPRRALEESNDTASVAPGWRTALPLVIGAVLAILALYWRTAESIVAIWWRSETFAHGFLIVPISLALVWMRRREVAKLEPTVDYVGVVMLAAAGVAWLVANAGQVQVVQHFALATMIPAAVIAIAGRRVAAALAFPLGFLFFGVPVGEGLIPPLMDWTADFTVAALQLTGMPVYREGNFFAIPSGNWSVVEGCSGVRYLIASITVGALFAYLSYRTLWKRLLFVLLSIVVPIIANGMRAYMIVMIAHLSDGKLAHGVDHFIYGWVFFGIVMMLLFWIGSFWRDDLETKNGTARTTAPRAGPPSVAHSSRHVMAGTFLAVVGIAAVWPAYAAYLDRAGAYAGALSLAAPAPAGGWERSESPLTDWRPRYEGAAASIFQVYRKGDRAVALYAAFYPRQREGKEQLLTSTNIMVALAQKKYVWSNMGESSRVEDLGRGSVEIRETMLRSAPQRLLVWDWFRVAGEDLSNRYVGKLLLAREKLLGRSDHGSAIILASPYEVRPDAAAATLSEFVRDMRPSIEAMIARAESDLAAARR